jgi:hypothetical protein
MTDDPLDRELDRMAGNPKVAKLIKESLERLGKGAAGPELAEMAKEVLAGRTSLGTVSQSSAYAGQFTEAADRFQTWFAELTPEKRKELEKATREAVGEPDGP